ncbi:MAG TPA: alpha-galactosidase [Dehalococcoidia bacterium]|nr:alpha-galactosidase [Chloroflexota bacterium]HIN16112.1 alpha-galactosidase [Dehalococcoidia bacterium]
MPKISLIGAGSVVFARRLLQDIMCVPELSDSTVSLMDTDPERLELMGKFARKLAIDTGTNMTIEVTGDRREALAGSNYVLTTIRVGDSFERDIAIPLKYGVDQSVGDTVGPGGVFKALRTAPVLLDICDDIEDVAPDATLLNYTNPMAIACWAIADATDVPTLGLCHSVQHTTADLADYIGAPRDSVTGWVAGINHLAWFLRFEQDGVDAYPRLFEAMENPEIYSRDTVRFEVMRQFGYFVTESTRHMSEYTPYFRTNEDLIDEFNLDQIRQDLQRRTARVDDHYTQLLEDANSDKRLTAERSEEYACRIIEAMETGRPTVINANVPNTGLIDNLLDQSCVEVPVLIDKLGFHPMAVGEIPGQLAALSRSNQAVQQMATQAILDGDREAAFHAIALDPLTSAVLSLSEIREMFDEMWTAHGTELAAYT